MLSSGGLNNSLDTIRDGIRQIFKDGRKLSGLLESIEDDQTAVRRDTEKHRELVGRIQTYQSRCERISRITQKTLQTVAPHNERIRRAPQFQPMRKDIYKNVRDLLTADFCEAAWYEAPIKTLWIQTPDIILTHSLQSEDGSQTIEVEVNLGKFQVQLPIPLIGSRGAQAFRAIALDPIYPVVPGTGQLSHPHINAAICFGNNEKPIRSLLRNGLIFEAFEMLVRLLNTYDHGNPFAPLQYWSREWALVRCVNCGEDVQRPDARACGCDDGPHLHCRDCYLSCRQCSRCECAKGEGFLENCPVCRQLLCKDHLVKCPDCDITMCGACLPTHIAKIHRCAPTEKMVLATMETKGLIKPMPGCDCPECTGTQTAWDKAYQEMHNNLSAQFRKEADERILAELAASPDVAVAIQSIQDGEANDEEENL